MVFLDVAWLASALKPLVHHNARKGPGGSIDLGRIGDRKIILRDKKINRSWHRLNKDAILEPEFARVLWPDVADFVLPTLESIGLTIRLPDHERGGLVVLLGLPEKCPEPVKSDLAAFRKKHSAALRVVWEMPFGVPPGTIEKVLATYSRLGSVGKF